VRCGTASTDDVTSQCVDVSAWCDGIADCDNAGDEALCDTGQYVSRSVGQSPPGQIVTSRRRQLGTRKSTIVLWLCVVPEKSVIASVSGLTMGWLLRLVTGGHWW